MESNNSESRKSNKPNFNFYWVYAGIGALLIAMILVRWCGQEVLAASVFSN